MTAQDDIVIYHNPACGTSRNTLALLREKGLEPKVVEYLKAGWTRDQLVELGLTDPATSDEAIIAAMILDPILVNRPIVSTPKGAALCRPAELVLGLL